LVEGLAVLENTDLRARLPELARPSAWIAGRRDRLIPWQAMQWSARQCGGAFTNVAGGGHAPFIGHTQAVIAALEPLLAREPA
jgi:pimeloyl-[acyl-carrier protein] methyl ester esterase